MASPVGALDDRHPGRPQALGQAPGRRERGGQHPIRLGDGVGVDAEVLQPSQRLEFLGRGTGSGV